MTSLPSGGLLPDLDQRLADGGIYDAATPGAASLPVTASHGDVVVKNSSKIVVAALMAAAAPWPLPAAAAPVASLPGLQNAGPPLVETVQYRRGWRGRYRGYGGAGLGLATGAIIGGAITGATQPYAYYGYPSYDPAYAYAPGYGPGYVAVSSDGGNEAAYCMQRFRSYDPASGTCRGFDGLRHPCP